MPTWAPGWRPSARASSWPPSSTDRGRGHRSPARSIGVNGLAAQLPPGSGSYIAVTLPSFVHSLWKCDASGCHSKRGTARHPSIGATRSMSSWQWRGGSGTSSLALVMRTSVPQIEHRNVNRTLRSSPGGGGGGGGVASPDSIENPILRISQPAITAIATATMLARVISQASTPATSRATRVGHEMLGLRTRSAYARGANSPTAPPARSPWRGGGGGPSLAGGDGAGGNPRERRRRPAPTAPAPTAPAVSG